MTNTPFFDWYLKGTTTNGVGILDLYFYCHFAICLQKKNKRNDAFHIRFIYQYVLVSQPDLVSESVIQFLEFEKTYLYGEWYLSKILMTLTIPISFIALGIAFWKRSLPIGICVIVLMATGKIIWSIQNAVDSGKSILFPAIIGLVICCGLTFYEYKRLEKK